MASMNEMAERVARAVWNERRRVHGAENELGEFGEDELIRNFLLNEARVAIAAMQEMVAGNKSGPFICGTTGTKDSLGLPEGFLICPHFGMAGFAHYTKAKDYSEPGY